MYTSFLLFALFVALVVEHSVQVEESAYGGLGKSSKRRRWFSKRRSGHDAVVESADDKANTAKYTFNKLRFFRGPKGLYVKNIGDGPRRGSNSRYRFRRHADEETELPSFVIDPHESDADLQQLWKDAVESLTRPYDPDTNYHSIIEVPSVTEFPEPGERSKATLKICGFTFEPTDKVLMIGLKDQETGRKYNILFMAGAGGLKIHGFRKEQLLKYGSEDGVHVNFTPEGMEWNL